MAKYIDENKAMRDYLQNTLGFSQEDVTNITNGLPIKTPTFLNVKIHSLSSFTQKQRETLVSYADMVSQSDLESKLILYPTTIYQIFNDWNDDREESDIDEELAKFCENIHDELVDQYIFN